MTNKLFNDRLHKLAEEVQAGRLKEMTFDLWHNGCCPDRTEAEAGEELGRWARCYGIKVDLDQRKVRNVAVIYLRFKVVP